MRKPTLRLAVGVGRTTGTLIDDHSAARTVAVLVELGWARSAFTILKKLFGAAISFPKTAKAKQRNVWPG